MYSVGPSVLVSWMRAAGEPSRLRLLTLCAESALSVSDLSHALRQSEPRVSRHLKILCEAGLIERLRQGQWVHYRLSPQAEAAGFVRGLLAQLDRRDPLLVRDRSKARAGDAHAGGTESRLGRALAALVGADGLSSSPVLLVGVDHPELLESAAQASPQCTAITHSRRAAQAARAHAERRGFSCRILPAGAPGGFSRADFVRAGSSFDTVLLDHPAAAGDSLAQVLGAARAVLSARGRLWLFAGYDALESSREKIVEHPLARLRRLLGEAGFECERITPVEADGEHVLAAVARAAAAEPERRAQQGGTER